MTTPAQTATIREAVSDDLPRLLQLLQQLSESSEHPEADVRPVEQIHRDTLAAIAADPRTRLMVVEDGGRLVGSLTFYVLPNLSHGGRPFAIVENVVVDAEARGGGYGRLLMDWAVAQAQAAGCYKLSLTSNIKRAPAHAFYEGIGFQDSHKGFTRYFEHE